MKDKILSFLTKLHHRLDKKAGALVLGAQGNTALLSAELVKRQMRQVDSCIAKVSKVSDGMDYIKLLMDIYPILQQEQQRVQDIVKIAPVPVHMQAVRHNSQSLEDFCQLISSIHEHYKLELPELPLMQTNKTLLSSLNRGNERDYHEWLQAIICENEKIMLLSSRNPKCIVENPPRELTTMYQLHCRRARLEIKITGSGITNSSACDSASDSWYGATCTIL